MSAAKTISCTKTSQDDCQVHKPIMIGKNSTQTIISPTSGKVCTQFQIEFNHSWLIARASTNPIQSTAKIKTAYVERIRENVTFQNDDSPTITLLDLHIICCLIIIGNEFTKVLFQHLIPIEKCHPHHRNWMGVYSVFINYSITVWWWYQLDSKLTDCKAQVLHFSLYLDQFKAYILFGSMMLVPSI